MCIPKGNIMKLTAKQLKRIIKEEVSSYREEQLNEVDPAMIAGLQQALTLSPESFKFIWSLVKAIPGIPAKYRELSQSYDEKKAQEETIQAAVKAANPDQRERITQLIQAIGEFSKNTGGDGFSNEEEDDLIKTAEKAFGRN
jgi:hypothetical protein